MHWLGTWWPVTGFQVYTHGPQLGIQGWGGGGVTEVNIMLTGSDLCTTYIIKKTTLYSPVQRTPTAGI
jgi:hypothetical protein